MRVKKAAAIVAAIALAITGCSRTEDNNGRTVIEFYQQNEAEVAIFEQIIRDFEAKSPSIKVTQVNVPEEESGNVLNTRIANGDAPDLFNEWFSQDFFDKIDNGVALDISASGLVASVNPALIEQTRYNNATYMLPITQNFVGVYYNRDIFTQYSISVPQTLPELWAVCETLHSNGIIPIAVGDKDGWNLAHWASGLIGNYLPNYSEDFLGIFDGTLAGTDVQGLDDVADIVIKRTEYAQPGPLGADTDAMIALFASQKAGMMFGGSWNMAPLNAAELGFEYRIFPFPGPSPSETTVMSNADFSLVFSAQSSAEKQSAAITFAEYLLGEGGRTYVQLTGAISGIVEVKTNSERFPTVMDLVDEGRIFRMPSHGRWANETYLEYTVALQNLVMSGDKEVFYREFAEALTNSGKPPTYID